MVRFENGFRIRAPRPRARAWKRFSTRALPTKAWLTTRSSTSRSWLFSALAMALSRHLRTSREMRFCENSRSASAVATFLPRMSCATRFSFCGETRSMRATALASLSGSARGVAALPILLPLRLLVRSVAVERAGRRELAKLVTHHFLAHVDGNVLLTVVDPESEAHELREDRGAAAPDLDNLVAARGTGSLGLLEEVAVDKRTLPKRTCHDVPLSLLLPSVTARHDKLVGPLVRTGFLALGRYAPRGHRMATTGGAALTTTVRVVDRVHGNAAVMRTLAEPAVTTSLTDRGVHVVRVRHRTDAGEALAMDQALLAGVQADRHVALVTTHDLSVGAGGAGECAALADFQLNIVDDRSHRHVADRHRVARLDVDLLAGRHLVADSQTLRGQDVGLLAVGVADQRDEGGAVRIVLDPLHGRHIAHTATTLEVDQTQGALVTTATEANGHATQVVTAAGGALALRQLLDRLALVELAAVHDHQLAQAGGDWFECFQSHRITLSTDQRPVVTSMVWPSARVTTAFFTSDRWPRVPRNIFTLPLVTSVLTLFTLTSNSFSTASLICGFVASSRTLKTTLFCSDRAVAFSVMTGLTITS